MTRALDAVIGEIRAECLHQVRLGYDEVHDDEHADSALASAAAAYAWIAQFYKDGPPNSVARNNVAAAITGLWPESWDPADFKPKSPREDLVRVAALCMAEIQRLDRAAAKPAAD